jgi:hypothetical protein
LIGLGHLLGEFADPALKLKIRFSIKGSVLHLVFRHQNALDICSKDEEHNQCRNEGCKREGNQPSDSETCGSLEPFQKRWRTNQAPRSAIGEALGPVAVRRCLPHPAKALVDRPRNRNDPFLAALADDPQPLALSMAVTGRAGASLMRRPQP